MSRSNTTHWRAVVAARPGPGLVDLDLGGGPVRARTDLDLATREQLLLRVRVTPQRLELTVVERDARAAVTERAMRFALPRQVPLSSAFGRLAALESLAAEEEDGEIDGTASIDGDFFADPEAPQITKVRSFDLDRPVSVEEAVFALDYVDHDFYAFRNAATGNVTVVYRRHGGGVGLIERGVVVERREPPEPRM